MPSKMTADEFGRLYSLLHRKDVFDVNTFTDASTKCRFVDCEMGEYWAKPRDVLYGSVQGHPSKKWKRGVESRLAIYGTKKLGGKKKRWTHKSESTLNDLPIKVRCCVQPIPQRQLPQETPLAQE